MVMNQRIGALAAVFFLGLGAAPARAGCSVVQTAGNEIVIKSGVGGCNTEALRAVLSSALAGQDGGAGPPAGDRQSPLADVKRSSGQGALWRLANINNQTPLTSLSMPGAR